jgi:hypothetical protein
VPGTESVARRPFRVVRYMISVFGRSFMQPFSSPTWGKGLLILWSVIAIPWNPIYTLMGTGIAFEGGPTLGAYLAVLVFWLYPIFLAVAWRLRRRVPVVVLLPALPLGVVLAGIWIDGL